MGGELNKKVKAVLENFYYLMDNSLSDKYKYALDIEKYGISNMKMSDIYAQAKKIILNLVI